jgi:hypothetical protein
MMAATRWRRNEPKTARISGDVRLIALNIAAAGPNWRSFPAWINVDAIGGVKSAAAGAVLIVGGHTELVRESRIDVIAAIERAKMSRTPALVV